MNSIETSLQQNYHSGHSNLVSGEVYKDFKALWPYFDSNYHFLLALPRDVTVIELGSGSGSLIAWLMERGFSNVTGIDVSLQEVQYANAQGIPLICADAFEHLSSLKVGSVDVVITKAMFEHIPKQAGADLLQAAERVLNPVGGQVVIDVPNMDWLLAGHERYMDVTHCVGYTRESIGQMCRMYFASVEVVGSVEPVRTAAAWLRIRLVKPVIVVCMRFLFRILGEGASNVLFENRSIIAVAKREKH